MQSISSQILTTDTQQLACWGEVWGVFCERKFWCMSFLNCCICYHFISDCVAMVSGCVLFKKVLKQRYYDGSADRAMAAVAVVVRQETYSSVILPGAGYMRCLKQHDITEMTVEIKDRFQTHFMIIKWRTVRYWWLGAKLQLLHC